MQPHRVIVSFVHGNAVGVILEPRDIDVTLSEQERAKSWEVRIGPLAHEAAIGTEFPEPEYRAVIKDLVAFLRARGVTGNA